MPKLIKLTQDKFAIVDDGDYEYLIQWKWFAKKAGRENNDKFYAARTGDIGNGKRGTIRMHRVLLGLSHNDKRMPDHIDRNGLNNQRDNLRIATRRQNNANRNSGKNSSSIFIGVCWHKKHKKWYVQIMNNGYKTWVGCFDNEHEAALAYNAAAIKIHGEFANLNIITK